MIRVDLVLPNGDVLSHHQYAGATPAVGDTVDAACDVPMVATRVVWAYVAISGGDYTGRPTCTPHVTIHLQERT